MSNLGKWDQWYKYSSDEIVPYGASNSYEKGARWLSGLKVEDWGCGLGFARKYIPQDKYVGLDGTKTVHSDKVVDLAEYIFEVEGIFMRHVLEHNYDWKVVLDNALQSFTHRMSLIIFTPMGDKTQEIAFIEELGVPDISFAEIDLVSLFEKYNVCWTKEIMASDLTYYGSEIIYYLEKEVSCGQNKRTIR